MSDKTVEYLTAFREYHSSDYALSTSSEDNFSPPETDGEHGSYQETLDRTDVSLNSDDRFENETRVTPGPDLPFVNEAKRRVLVRIAMLP